MYRIHENKVNAKPRRNEPAGTDRPYVEPEQYPDPTLCTECGALYTKGRWSWDDIPEQPAQTLCPACRRTNDHEPAGCLELSGEYFNSHRTEIMNLVQHIKYREIAEHPLERIMDTLEEDEKTVILTTGAHLARSIGNALHTTYEGDLKEYDQGTGSQLNICWKK